MSPLEIQVLLHYHTKNTDWPNIDRKSEDERLVFDCFIQSEILVLAESGRKYKLSRGGVAAVQLLLNVDLPHANWTNSRVGKQTARDYMSPYLMEHEKYNLKERCVQEFKPNAG